MVSSLAQPPPPVLEKVLAHLKEVRPTLRGWKACCPAHADHTPSLSIGLGEQGQVLLKCFAGCSLEHIVEAMGLTTTDLFPDVVSTADGPTVPSGTSQRQTLTLLDLALEKQLPWQFLFKLGVMEHPSGGLHIPYHLPDGSLAPRQRIRTALAAKEGSYWSKGEGSIVPYGLERLDEARKAGYLVVVEGESDCWTLWYQGFPALGLPGAEMTGTLEESMLTGIDQLYIMQEPDAGGKAFVTGIARRLKTWQWQGKASVLHLSGAKDPNALHIQGRQAFRVAFQHALEQAEPLLVRYSQQPSASREGQPVIFSLQDLLSWELPPVRWAVSEILPEGLTLLAGKPKLGKSWLALSLGLSIAAGSMALSAQPVTQGDVLYLALEDNARRLQARAKQLLASMTTVPSGMDFAVEWPRLGEGGLTCLEDYLKAHPQTRLVVIDTWAKLAPPSGERRCAQYEGDYEALTPLKRLADTYHVSIVAIHHLRKTASTDVLDEIIGSTGITGAVDGALVLKRERGQTDATLFVTGRDVECEQQLALSFDTTTAQWALVGNAEEVGRTRARQEILDLLREQHPDGMSAREVAEALEKNIHTTRTLLRKMEDTGEIRRFDGRYVALSLDSGQNQHRSPGVANQQPDLVKQEDHMQHRSGDHDSDDSDDGDDSDDDNDAAADALSNGMTRHERAISQEIPWSATLTEGVAEMQQDSVNAIITVINRHHCHQSEASTRTEGVQSEYPVRPNRAMQAEQGESLRKQQNHCPHHPHERRVRFDPAGQAWCDKLDCWDCYRLMKIGEALGYRCLTDQRDHRIIDRGMEAWSDYVLSQRPPMVVVATQLAIEMCTALNIEMPDVSGEVRHVVEVCPTDT